jgi:hypothetical protein
MIKTFIKNVFIMKLIKYLGFGSLALLMLCTGFQARAASIDDLLPLLKSLEELVAILKNDAGLVAQVASGTDSIAPEIPYAVRYVMATPTEVKLRWASSTDNVATAGYKVFRSVNNGALSQIGTTAVASYTDSGVTQGVYYFYKVSAFDAAGNESLASGVGFTIPVTVTQPTSDTTAPLVSVTSPQSGSAISDTTVFSASASDNVGVVGVQFILDGVTIGSEDTVAPYSLAWKSTFGTVGSHALAAVARDAAGNRKTSDPVSITIAATPRVDTIDATPPTFPILGPLKIGISQTTFSLGWFAAADNVGVTGYHIYRSVSGGSFTRVASVSSTNYLDTNLISSTRYAYEINAYDAAGNESTQKLTAEGMTQAASEKHPPTVSITAPANGATVSGMVTTNASASDDTGVAGVQFKFNGSNLGAEDTVSPYSVTWDSRAISNGTYGLTAVARDVAGNVTTSSVINVTVNNGGINPPSVSVSSPVNGTTVSGGIILSATATDDKSGIFIHFKLDGADIGPEIATTTYLQLFGTNDFANGAHVLTAVARDSDGNVANSSPVNLTFANFPGSGTTTAVYNFAGTDSDYGEALAVDLNGNKYVGGSVAGRPYIIKVAAAGSGWALNFASAGSIKSIAIDPNGNVYAAGYFYGTTDFGDGPVVSSGGYDMFIVKYNSGGVLQWKKVFGSPQGADFAGDESVNAVTIDTAGNVVLVGSYLDTTVFGTSKGGKDGFIAKFTSGGTLLWYKTFGNTGTDDAATAVITDSNNNIYVTGRFSVDINLGGTTLTAAGSYDIFTAKFSSSGTHLWSTRGGGGGYDTSGGITLDSSLNPIVVGDYRLRANFGSTTDFIGLGEEDIFLVKYSSTTGSHVWSRSFGSWNTDKGQGIDAEGDDIYITGRAGGPINFGGGTITPVRNGYNAGMAKFNSAGTHQWSTVIGHGKEDGKGIVATGSAVYWIGRFASAPTATAPDTVYTKFGNGYNVSNIGTNQNPDIFLLRTTR